MPLKNLDAPPSGVDRLASAAPWILPVAIGTALFTIAFLIISIVALCRARVQDIPDTVRALAQLLPFRSPRTIADDEHAAAR